MLKHCVFALSLSAGASYAADSSAVFRGQVHAQERGFGFDYGDFSAEVSLDGLDAALAGGFDQNVEALPPSDPGDDNCEYVYRSKFPATLKVRIYGRKPGAADLLKVIDRTYAVDLYAARSGTSPCESFALDHVEASIRDVVAVDDLLSGDEYRPTSKILDKQPGPHGQRFGWDTYTVLSFNPVLHVALDQSQRPVGPAEVALDLLVSEYGKSDGLAVMSQAGSYFHGFSARVPLKR